MTLDEKKLLIEIRQELEDVKKAVMAIPEWISIGDLARDRGMSRQTIRAQLLKGEFEPEVDFKSIGNKIYVARSAVFRIKGKRS